MDYLIDTDIVIDFLKGKKSSIQLLGNISSETLYLSIVSWTEIMYGIRKLASTKRKSEFEQFLLEAKISILPVNQDIGEVFVEEKVTLEERGERLEDFDLLIAATAKVSRLVLVTRNVKHFQRIPGLKLYR